MEEWLPVLFGCVVGSLAGLRRSDPALVRLPRRALLGAPPLGILAAWLNGEIPAEPWAPVGDTLLVAVALVAADAVARAVARALRAEPAGAPSTR